jgi:hypothetical protein
LDLDSNLFSIFFLLLPIIIITIIIVGGTYWGLNSGLDRSSTTRAMPQPFSLWLFFRYRLRFFFLFFWPGQSQQLPSHYTFHTHGITDNHCDQPAHCLRWGPINLFSLAGPEPQSSQIHLLNSWITGLSHSAQLFSYL